MKWPNDVLLTVEGEERKVAGILVERVETPIGPAAVVGIGLNVGMTADELPVPEATSLAVAGDAPDRTELLGLVLDDPLGLVRRLAGGRRARPRPGSRRRTPPRCATVGRDVSVALPGGETFTGRAVEIDASGRLVVSSGGERTAVGAGDVVHVRDA